MVNGSENLEKYNRKFDKTVIEDRSSAAVAFCEGNLTEEEAREVYESLDDNWEGSFYLCCLNRAYDKKVNSIEKWVKRDLSWLDLDVLKETWSRNTGIDIEELTSKL